MVVPKRARASTGSESGHPPKQSKASTRIKSKAIITLDQDSDGKDAAGSETVKGKNSDVGDGDDDPDKETKGMKPPAVDEYGYPPLHDLENPSSDEPYGPCLRCIAQSIPCHG